MLVKTTNNNTTIDRFPYTESELRADHPNVSFPVPIPVQTLTEFGVYPVTVKVRPAYDATTHKLSRNTLPEKENGEWVIGWTLTPLNQTEIDDIWGMYKAKVTVEADRRVGIIAGDSTDKLLALMTAVDLLDVRNDRAWTPSEVSTMNHLRSVKTAVQAIRVAEATIKASMDLMTGAELQAVDIPNHPSWP